MPDLFSHIASFFSRCAYLLLGVVVAVVYLLVTGALVLWLLFQPSAMDKPLLGDDFDPPNNDPGNLRHPAALRG